MAGVGDFKSTLVLGDLSPAEEMIDSQERALDVFLVGLLLYRQGDFPYRI